MGELTSIEDLQKAIKPLEDYLQKSGYTKSKGYGSNVKLDHRHLAQTAWEKGKLRVFVDATHDKNKDVVYDIGIRTTDGRKVLPIPASSSSTIKGLLKTLEKELPDAESEINEDMVELPERMPSFEEYDCIMNAIESLGKLTKEEINTIVEDVIDNLKSTGVEIEDGDMSESFLGKALGMATGALAGPAIGRAVARGLGIKAGIMFDLMTSRLVGAAIGKEIMKLI